MAEENEVIGESEEHEDVVMVEDMEDDELYQVVLVAPGSFWKTVYGVLESLPGLYPRGMNEFIIDSVREKIERL